MLQPRVLRRGALVGGDQIANGVDEREPQHVRRIDEERIVAAATDGFGQLREGAFQHARRLEEPPRPGIARPQHLEQPAGRLAVPAHRRIAEVAQVVEQRVPGLHVATADRLGGFERERQREAFGRRPHEIERAVARHQPAPAGGCGRRVPSLRAPGAHLLETPSQQRRRDERGGEDDQQQRGVLILVEDGLS